MAAADADPSRASSRRRGLDRQRQLTVISVDIVGSTPLAEVLDNERWRDILLTFHDICDQAISRYGGAISTRMGDGLMAHFGLDEPHEDDPRRAVLAGLAIQRGIVPLTKTVEDEDRQDFRVRVGVHTGPVLITQIDDRREMVGSTANETARIESAALPGTVAISNAAQRLIGDEFEYDDPREVELKGVSRPMQLYTVFGTTVAERPPSTTPLVGRSVERVQLTDLWTALCEGREEKRAALILGEAGIGKSRLAEHVTGIARLDGARPLRLETRGFDSTVPLHPISAALEKRFGLQEADDAEDRYHLLHDGLTEMGAGPAAPILGRLFGLGPDALDGATSTDPSVIREQMLRAASEWITAVAAAGPTVLTIEDLHWADDATLALLDRLIQNPPPNLLLLMTARSDFESLWSGHDVLSIGLGPLPEKDVVRLAEFNLAGSTPTDEELEALVQASDGNPLYVDRLLGTLGIEALIGDTGVPDSLDHLLTTIIEAPGVDQQLVGLLATIGRRLDVSFVSEVLQQPPDEVIGRLDGLCEHGILEPFGAGARPAFFFHHALVQSAAYEHQLGSDRKLAHATIADAIERARGAVEIDHQSVARHLDLAGRPAEAVPYYLEASKAAPRRGAVLEARRFAERGLELLADLPVDARSHNLEIQLQLQLAFTITSLKGYASTAAAESAERARELSGNGADAGPSFLTMRALVAVFTHYMARARRDESAEILQELRDLVGSGPNEHVADQLEALHIWHLGRFVQSRELYLMVIDHLEGEDAAGRFEHAAVPGDHLASAYIQMGPINFQLGDADEAFDSIDKALKRAQSVEGVKGAFTEGWANSWLLYLQIQSGDPEAALQTASDTLAFCERNGLTMWGHLTKAYQAVAQGLLTPSDEQVATLSSHVASSQATGAVTLVPYFLIQRARLLNALGRPSEAIEGFTDAVDTARRNQEVQEIAEGYRLRGVTHASLGHVGEATADLLQAASIAADQNAVVFHLRALCDIVQFLDAASRPDSAVDDLSRVIGSVRSPDRYPEIALGRLLLERTATTGS